MRVDRAKGGKTIRITCRGRRESASTCSSTAAGKVTVQKQNGDIKHIGGEIARDVNEFFCPSYFARDKIDKLFN